MPSLDSNRTADLVGGLVVVGLGGAWSWFAGDYGYVGEGGRLAPGTLPGLAGLILVACGLVVVFMAIGRPATGEAQAADSLQDRPTGSTPPRVGAWRRDGRRLVLLAGLVACLLLAPLVGFTAGFAILAFLVVKFVEHRSIGAAVASAVVMYATGFLLFELFLQVPLP